MKPIHLMLALANSGATLLPEAALKSKLTSAWKTIDVGLLHKNAGIHKHANNINACAKAVIMDAHTWFWIP